MKLTEEQKEGRRIEKEYLKKVQKIENEKNQSPIKEMIITVEWKESRTWGMNPHCEATIKFHNGKWERSINYTTSGCGYDKLSTVVAKVFNDYLKYKLWNKTIEQCERADYDWKSKGKAPYGVSASTYTDNSKVIEYRSFNEGIGIDCYKAIGEFIGGKFECIASGTSFDVYKYTDN